MATNRHYGPLRIQRPFYPEANGRCHCYVLHPPGGIAGGDRLSIRVDVNDAAKVLLTSPGAGKFYRCEDKRGQLHTSLDVAANASLDWLPQETLFFNGTQAKTHTEIRIDKTSRLIAWDIACLGRPAAKELFIDGKIDQKLKLTIGGVPHLIERTQLINSDPALHGVWGFAGFSVNAVFIANQISDALYALLQTFNAHNDDSLLGISRKRDVVIARYLGHSAEQAKQSFIQIIQAVREHRDAETFELPRIWQT